MPRTDNDRYDQAVAYLKNHVDVSLASNVVIKTGGNRTALGKKISLGGAGYWKTGSSGQHMAIRALLLCQQLYLAPHAGLKFNYSADSVKNAFRSKSEDEVKKAIRSFTVKPGRTLERFAAAAEAIKQPNGSFNFETRVRGEQTLGDSPICFNAVKLWLFNAGFVSLQWLATKGLLIDAHHANEHLGMGEIVPRNQIDQIPRGYIFNFHAEKSVSVCHWGVSLGGGWAAGANTTPSADYVDHKTKTKSTAAVTFRSGGSVYGEFTLASSADVCRLKYALYGQDALPIVIRKIDPTKVTYG